MNTSCKKIMVWKESSDEKEVTKEEEKEVESSDIYLKKDINQRAGG